jgi:phage baseplate assembly protein gpV
MINQIRRIVSEAMAQQPQNRWGVVESVDPARMAVRVLIQPEGVLSGWLPIQGAAASSGWTMLAVPSIGDMACVVPDAGEALGSVSGFAHNDGRLAPKAPSGLTGGNSSAVPGELLFIGKGGTTVRLCADGTLLIVGDINVRGSITTTGSVHAQGNVLSDMNVQAALAVKDLNGASGTLQQLRAAYDVHKHGGVQSGGSLTNTTDTPV